MPPAPLTASRTFDSTLAGSLPDVTSAIFVPASWPPTSRGNSALSSCSRTLRPACAVRASPRALFRSPRSEEAMSRLAWETTVSPSEDPRTIPIPSARNTATSDSAW